MYFDFPEDGVCHIRKEDRVKDSIFTRPEESKETDKVLTPASFDFCEKGTCALLSKEKRDILHCAISKGI